MNKKWNKREKDPGFPTIIQANGLKQSDTDKNQVIAFKSGNTTNTAELVDYDDEVGADDDTQIWKTGEKFHNEYFTIKHYTGKLNEYQDTGRYLSANGTAEPTVKVKQGKKNCYVPRISCYQLLK